MAKLRASARRALGKGAGLRRSATLELMAHGGPAADPQVSADLSTVRVWHRRLLAGRVEWPLEASLWNDALKPGRGRAPSAILSRWPIVLDGCQTLAAGAAKALCAQVASTRPDFAGRGLAAALSTAAYRQLA
eukprot:4673745-Amphidinium_carterae.1